MKILIVVFLILISLNNCAQSEQAVFNRISSDKNWNLRFIDSCKSNWKNNWMLDGLKANIKNTNQGMIFSAGPIAKDDSCHAVLWTKESFQGDVKIEYEYTKIDFQKKFVNILYIQATGISPQDKDIMKWSDERVIPSMYQYFDKMQCLHISYAAYGNTGDKYIRARRYPRLKNRNFNTSTEIPPSYSKIDLFKTGITYKITVIKKENNLYMNVKYKDISKLFHWKLKPEQKVEFGRIGLRHMYTRSSRYKNFKIYTLD